MEKKSWCKIAIWVLCCSFVGCGENGPKIIPDLNFMNLCVDNNVSGETERRCLTERNCSLDQNEFCWRPEAQTCAAECKGGSCIHNLCLKSCFNQGDCDAGTSCEKQCTIWPEDCQSCQGGSCVDPSHVCDNGFCHKPCSNNDACQGEESSCIDGFCRRSNVCISQGHCRECDEKAHQCDFGKECDFGFCHKTCVGTDECSGTQKCTNGFCRTPHRAEFNFCNKGNQDLEIYLDRTELHGQQDACAFSRWTWSHSDQATVVLPKDSCDLFLHISYTPPDVGQYRAFFYVFSNATNVNPLPLLLCANAIEAKCEVFLDGSCPECAPCTEAHFTQMMQDNPTPDCSDYR